MQEEHPLQVRPRGLRAPGWWRLWRACPRPRRAALPPAPQVSRCTKIINPNTDDAKYVINIKQIAKFVVGLGDKVAPTDIEEGMRVG